MPYGGWNGAAEGLKTGIMLGNQFNETQAKRDALMQETIKEKITQYSKVMDQGLLAMKSTIENVNDRSSPNEKAAIDAQRDTLVQTAKIMGTINPQIGQHYEQMVSTIYTATKDKATQFSDAQTQQGKEMEADLKFFRGGQSQPTVGAQAPAGPAAPPPGPTMAPPTQQVAEEPTAGLTSQAAAQPPMPAMDMPAPMPAAAPPVGAPEAPMPAAAPSPAPAPAAAPQGMDPMEQRIRERYIEGKYKPTAMEQGMQEGWRKVFFEMQPTVQAAEKAVKTNARARQLLAEGIYTGISAKVGLVTGKITGSDREKVRRTEEFLALLGQGIGQQLKQFGSATAVSNLDLQTVEQYIGKDITLNEESIDAILKLNEEGARNTINNYNRIAPNVGQPPIQMPQTEDAGGMPNYTPDADGWVTIGRSRIQVQ